jgi:hypothetical protein
MCFTGAGTTNKAQIPGLFKKMAAVEISDQRLIDVRIGKLEAVQVLGHQKARRAHLVTN